MPCRRTNLLTDSFTREEAEADLGSEDTWSSDDMPTHSDLDFIDDSEVEEGEITESDPDYVPFDRQQRKFLSKYREPLQALFDNLMYEGRVLLGPDFMSDVLFEHFVWFVYEHTGFF